MADNLKQHWACLALGWGPLSYQMQILMHKYISLGLPLLLRAQHTAYKAIFLISVAKKTQVVLSTGECDRHCQRTAKSCKYKWGFKKIDMMLAHSQIILQVLAKKTEESFTGSRRSSSQCFLRSL